VKERREQIFYVKGVACKDILFQVYFRKRPRCDGALEGKMTGGRPALALRTGAQMNKLSRRSVLTSAAAFPALAILADAASAADDETMVGRAEQEHAGLLFAETCIKPSIAAPNGLRWFRL
jgi:hypothetical protein